MNLQPLQPQQLAGVQQLAARLFPYEDEHQQALAAVVCPDVRDAFTARRQLAGVRCLTSSEGDELAGFASLYEYAAQPDEMWLAWFGLKEAFRGRGAGAELMDAVISLGRREQRHTLRLWTTDEREYGAALRLYLRRGFTVETCPPLPGETWTCHVLSLGLTSLGARPFTSLLHPPALCGRESALVAA
jgi:GNAT superfamily N-acetyltransferase